MNSIQILPNHVIDQIKAGEIVERPAYLIKELIENAIDAHATRIEIFYSDVGLSLISIEDNGDGMDFENLRKAFLRHATSKLRAYDDLWHLYSFGFRGEALASIAASADVTCTSMSKNEDYPLDLRGGKISIQGGHETLYIPYQQSATGTSFFIKNLFYNTPARLNFLKSQKMEGQAITKMINTFALSHPQIQFQCAHDEEKKEIYYPTDEYNRVIDIFNLKKNPSSLIKASEEYDCYTLTIYFTKETHSSPQYRHHYQFINQRLFVDKKLHQDIVRHLETIWPQGKTGHYAVFINGPREEVDINVHPNKTVVKFLRPDIIYTLLGSALKKSLKKEFPNISEGGAGAGASVSGSMANPFIPKPVTAVDENPNSEIFLSPIPGVLKFVDSLTVEYFLAKDTSELRYLGKSSSLLIHYFLQKKLSLKQFELNPLIVTEPLKIEIQGPEYFQLLANWGVEADSLGPSVIAVRAISQHIPRMILAQYVDFILFLSSELGTESDLWPINQLNEVASNYSFGKHVTNPWPFLGLIFEQVKSTDFLEKNLYPLNDQDLSKIFF